MIKRILNSTNVDFPPNYLPIPKSQICIQNQIINGVKSTLYYRTSVQPNVEANPVHPERVVVIWEYSRSSIAATMEIGVAYSGNFGKKWEYTVVPLQRCIGGVFDRISSPWLYYSIDGNALYLCVIAYNTNKVESAQYQGAILVAISYDDGKTWPDIKVVGTTDFFLNQTVPNIDSPITERNTIFPHPSKPLIAYVSYNFFETVASTNSVSYISKTIDQGKTFFPPVESYNATFDLETTGLSNGNPLNNQIANSQILVAPDNTVYNFFTRKYATRTATNEQFLKDRFPHKYIVADLAFVKSNDEGNSWSKVAQIVAPLSLNTQIYSGGYSYDFSNRITGGIGDLIRSGVVSPQYILNPTNGNIYIAYQTGQFRSDQLSSIALVVSRDNGKTFSSPIMINKTPQDVINPQAYTPILAVSDSGIVGIKYTDLRFDDMSDLQQTKADSWLAFYKDTGKDFAFIKEFRLTEKSYIIQNGANTDAIANFNTTVYEGYMVNADYDDLINVGEYFYVVDIRTFDGPFNEPKLIFEQGATKFYLDDNVRSSPFINIFKIEDCDVQFKVNDLLI